MSEKMVTTKVAMVAMTKDAIRASLDDEEAARRRPLFDAAHASEEFLSSLNAEIAAQSFAEAEDAFAAAQLEPEFEPEA